MKQDLFQETNIVNYNFTKYNVNENNSGRESTSSSSIKPYFEHPIPYIPFRQKTIKTEVPRLFPCFIREVKLNREPVS